MAHDSELSGQMRQRFAPTEDRSTQPGPDAGQQRPSVAPDLSNAQSSPGQRAAPASAGLATPEWPSASGSAQTEPASSRAQAGAGAPAAPAATSPVDSPAPGQGSADDADAAPADNVAATPSTTSGPWGPRSAAAQAAPDRGATGAVALVEPAQAASFQHRWSDVQAGFVDDPQEAVSAADALVAELMQYLAASFAGHKTRLEAQWNRGSETETEELRVALQRYRSFFHRLLAT